MLGGKGAWVKLSRVVHSVVDRWRKVALGRYRQFGEGPARKEIEAAPWFLLR